MSTTAVTPNPDKIERETPDSLLAGYFGRNGAAEFLDVSTRTIDDAIRTGELEAFRVGRRVLIRRDSLIEFAERVSA